LQPERPVQTTLAFHASRIIIDAGVLLAMASMSLAFVVADSGNRSALDADALPALLLLLPVFAITLIPDHTRPLHPVAAWLALVFGLAALPYAFVKMLDAGILADTLDGTVGTGPWLMVAGSTITLVGIAIGLYRNLRGLPAGGTPGRSAAFRTRSETPTSPEVTPPSKRTPRPGPAKPADVAPTGLLPAAPGPERASEPDTPRTALFSQPEILFPDTGAVAREADPDTEPESPHLDAAERADAAIDDHFMSLFDADETAESEE